MDEACCMKRFKLSRIVVCKNQGIYHCHGDQTLNKTQRKRSIKKSTIWLEPFYVVFLFPPTDGGVGLLEILKLPTGQNHCLCQCTLPLTQWHLG